MKIIRSVLTILGTVGIIQCLTVAPNTLQYTVTSGFSCLMLWLSVTTFKEA